MGEMLNIFQDVHFDETITKSDIHTYLPYSSSNYGLSEEIRILIQSQDLITATYDSFLYIEGKIERKAEDHLKQCHLTNNFASFLFEEIRYELGGQRVDVCRNPGITSALKGYVSYTTAESKALAHLGWSPKNEEPLQVEYTKTDDNVSKYFSVCIPLKHIFGMMEDYHQVIVNMKQELILIRSRGDADCYQSEADATIKLSKIQWKVPHLTLGDTAKLNLFERINKNVAISIPFRQWELYELPALKQASMDIWPIKTSTQLEKPRWVIVAFQKNKKFSKSEKAANFDNVNIRNIKLHLNSESYPYEAMHLDFNENKYIVAYHQFLAFRQNYYAKDEQDALFDYSQFKNCPIFVIDCSKQNETLKNSTVDIKLEIESRSSFDAGIVAYCLILHDALIQYNPLTGEVKKL
ncbi:uncharacterized protein LOC116182751 [Photinus pyralis]|uniref:uncharacterized protein LOC116182751 n=1 Tax=Photinus pyralis TaxID=7054 RepID=UPI0012676286|nr:uncharacterized protein LOC116182751 [Photinus pyralis]